MPEVDVVDATWFGVPPATLATAVADPDNWRHWWPELNLAVDQLRGPKGVRWFVRDGRDGTRPGDTPRRWSSGTEGEERPYGMLYLCAT